MVSHTKENTIVSMVKWSLNKAPMQKLLPCVKTTTYPISFAGWPTAEMMSCANGSWLRKAAFSTWDCRVPTLNKSRRSSSTTSGSIMSLSKRATLNGRTSRVTSFSTSKKKRKSISDPQITSKYPSRRLSTWLASAKFSYARESLMSLFRSWPRSRQHTLELAWLLS